MNFEVYRLKIYILKLLDYKRLQKNRFLKLHLVLITTETLLKSRRKPNLR